MWKRLIRHFKRWNIWRKRNLNSRFHKFLTLLFGGRYSPTFANTLTDEEAEQWTDALHKALVKRGYTIDI